MSKWGIEEKETLEAINNIGFFGNILNVAAGDGRFNNKLLELSQKVTAIDIDDSELQSLREKCPSNLIDKLYTKNVDITQEFPFEDATFDGVFCTGTLHLFDKETISRILKEIKRVLKVNGVLVLDFATDIKRFDKNGIQVVFEGEGNFTTEEAVLLLTEELKDLSLEIQKSTFKEENLDDNTGYRFITGNFLIISGKVKKKDKNKSDER